MLFRLPARLWRLCCVAFSLLCLTACIQMRLTPAEAGARQDSSLDQVQRQAMGRSSGRAPAQLHLPLESAPPALADDVPVPALAQAKTFLGTIPCHDNACEASRLSLTLAPMGHWRARSTTLAAPPAETAEQGCWEVVKRDPLRIVLLTENGVARATLGFVQDHVLRVIAYNSIAPALAYHLTQQADVDPIDALQGRALADCKSPN